MSQLIELSNDTLFRKAPSVFAQQPWGGVSDRYSFVPTIDIIDRLRDEAGLVPVNVKVARTRHGSGKSGYQKHEIRLVHRDAVNGQIMAVGDSYATVNLTNSHDTGSALSIDAGIYRLICSNGMMVPDGIAQSVRVRHTGDLHDVIEGVFTVANEANELIHVVHEYQGIELQPEHQVAFATAALELRESTLPVTASQILRPRRYQDSSDRNYGLPKADLYTTLNVIQENLVKGGQRSNSTTGRRASTRAITDIAQDQKLNKSLFILAEALKKQIG